SWNSHKGLIRNLFSLGFILMASDIIGNLCNYLLLIAIRKIGNIDDVGFFQAANNITNQMVSVVFTAMALDYFPRLSGAASDFKKMTGIINRQSEIIALIILPISLLIIIFAPLIVKVLLSPKFEVIVPLLRWMALGVALKAMAYPVAYITFAKDNKKLFFWLEGVVGNLLFLIAPLVFFLKFGLIGFGYGMVAEQTLCLMIYWGVNRHLYGYTPTPRIFALFFGVILMIAVVLGFSYLPHSSYISGAMIIISGAALIVCIMRLKNLIRKK
ncbi:MAG: oligosaccharide flippase family protein, partial [Muribaculaceae bacterium]|nr:oligosaccharide flippase family protein [Muribaculaceae bacterium]